MKELNLIIECRAYYKTSLMVEDNMSIEDAVRYAEEQIDELKYEDLEYVPGHDAIDKVNSYFS